MGNTEVDATDAPVSDYEHALKTARADAAETALALENLVKGMQAVKRILERPVVGDDAERDSAGSSVVNESADAGLVSELSEGLVGVLGSELIGLLNAAQMAKGYARLSVEEDTAALRDLHRTRECAQKSIDRANRAETMGRRLKKEKKHLVREVRALRGDRQVLVKEVKSLRKRIQSTKKCDAWRLLQDHLRDAMMVHESVLSNKTFTSTFAGIDPPGTKDTKDTDMADRNPNFPSHADDASRISATSRISSNSEKENKIQSPHYPRKENDGQEALNNKAQRALRYIEGGKKPSLFKPRSSPNSKSTPKSKSASSPTNKRGLSFSTGISNSFTTGLGRFKNVLQEASDQMLHENREQSTQQASDTQKKPEKSLKTKNTNTQEKQSIDASVNLTTDSSSCKLMDDAATKSTKSCSFDADAIKTSLDLSTSISTCGDIELPNDLAFQISIDEGSSFLNTLGASPNPGIVSPASMMITPEPSPVIVKHSETYEKPMCNPDVLRTLAIPTGHPKRNIGKSYSAMKTRLHSLNVR